jgi:hypothetical protein
MVFDSPKDPPPEPEPETPPAEKIQPPQISAPSRRKKLLLGLIAGATVLGLLIFYLISDRQTPQKKVSQPIVAKKDKPEKDSDTASPPVAADRPSKKYESNSATKFSAAKRSPSLKPASQKSAEKIRPDYDRLLTQKASKMD